MIVSDNVQAIRNAFDAGGDYRKVCLTIGNFDGVHAGHRSLFSAVREEADAGSLLSVAVTFTPHPLKVLAPERAPRLIVSRDEKMNLIGRTGMDAVLEIHFNWDIARMAPEDFVVKHLMPLRPAKLVIGWDFSLGRGRSGNAEVLRQIGAEHGFTVRQMPAFRIGGEVISSTRIRKSLSAGVVAGLPGMSEYLRPVDAVVASVKYNGGVPEAEISVQDIMLPGSGLYEAKIQDESLMCPALVRIDGSQTPRVQTLHPRRASWKQGSALRLFLIRDVTEDAKTVRQSAGSWLQPVPDCDMFQQSPAV